MVRKLQVVQIFCSSSTLKVIILRNQMNEFFHWGLNLIYTISGGWLKWRIVLWSSHQIAGCPKLPKSGITSDSFRHSSSYFWVSTRSISSTIVSIKNIYFADGVSIEKPIAKIMSNNPVSTNIPKNGFEIQSFTWSDSFSAVTTSLFHVIKFTFKLFWGQLDFKTWFLSLHQKPARPQNPQIAINED